MQGQSREILPVAVTELERRIQIEKDMSDEIALSTYDLENLTDTTWRELEQEFATSQRRIGQLTTELTVMIERAA